MTKFAIDGRLLTRATEEIIGRYQPPVADADRFEDWITRRFAEAVRRDPDLSTPLNAASAHRMGIDCTADTRGNALNAYGEEIRNPSTMRFEGRYHEAISTFLDMARSPYDEDKTIYRKFERMGLDQITEHADRYRERQATREASQFPVLGEEHEKTVETFANGYRFVQMGSAKARAIEGNNMSHCVGAAEYGKLGRYGGVFSLRDENNRPHATAHIDADQIHQIRGYGNSVVADRYGDMIRKGVEIVQREFRAKFEEDKKDSDCIRKEAIDGGDIREIMQKGNYTLSHVRNLDGFDASINSYTKFENYEDAEQIRNDNAHIVEGFRNGAELGVVEVSIRQMPVGYLVVSSSSIRPDRDNSDVDYTRFVENMDSTLDHLMVRARINGDLSQPIPDGVHESGLSPYEHHRIENEKIVATTIKTAHFESHYDHNWDRHREDAPAVVNSEGKAWYCHGVLHRLDGPAVEKSDGTKNFHYYGRPLTETEGRQMVKEYEDWKAKPPTDPTKPQHFIPSLEKSLEKNMKPTDIGKCGDYTFTTLPKYPTKQDRFLSPLEMLEVSKHGEIVGFVHFDTLAAENGLRDFVLQTYDEIDKEEAKGIRTAIAKNPSFVDTLMLRHAINGDISKPIPDGEYSQRAKQRDIHGTVNHITTYENEKEVGKRIESAHSIKRFDGEGVLHSTTHAAEEDTFDEHYRLRGQEYPKEVWERVVGRNAPTRDIDQPAAHEIEIEIDEWQAAREALERQQQQHMHLAR